MPTNKDWLFSLPLDEQLAWMNAEHVEGVERECVELRAELDELKAERELHRSKLGECADLAEQIRNVAMGFGDAALVDLEGNVV